MSSRLQRWKQIELPKLSDVIIEKYLDKLGDPNPELICLDCGNGLLELFRRRSLEGFDRMSEVHDGGEQCRRFEIVRVVFDPTLQHINDAKSNRSSRSPHPRE